MGVKYPAVPRTSAGMKDLFTRLINSQRICTWIIWMAAEIVHGKVRLEV
jgi:hypothetical protein